MVSVLSACWNVWRNARIAELVSPLGRTVPEIRCIVSKYGSAQETIGKLQGDLAKVRTERDKAIKSLAESESNAGRLGARIERLESLLESAEQDNIELSDEVDRLEKSRRSLKGWLTRVNGKSED